MSVECSAGGPEPPPDSIAGHGTPYSGHRQPDASRPHRVHRGVDAHDPDLGEAAFRPHGGEPAPSTQRALVAQRGPVGVSRWRPFRRRALRTLRPPGVAMRTRKPWVLRRYAFLGWYVRLMAALLHEPSRISSGGTRAATGGRRNGRQYSRQPPAPACCRGCAACPPPLSAAAGCPTDLQNMPAGSGAIVGHHAHC
jgi:hypothetical protein